MIHHPDAASSHSELWNLGRHPSMPPNTETDTVPRDARRNAAHTVRILSHDNELGYTARTVITNDGVPLAVRDYGKPAATHTVFLLHGFCLSTQTWGLQISQLRRQWGERLRIISYDHRGHGASGDAPIRSYRIDQLGADLADVLRALDITGPLTLAGHSMGGMAALAYLGRPTTGRPIDPSALILVATAAGRLCERGLGRLLASPALHLLYGLIQHAPHAVTDDPVHLLAHAVCKALTRYGGYGITAEDALVTLSAAAINDTALATKVGFLPGLQTYDQYSTLASIGAATTVIAGGADRLTPPAHARDLVAGIPNARLLYRPTAGHMLLHETPELVSAAISTAVAGASRTRQPHRTSHRKVLMP